MNNTPSGTKESPFISPAGLAFKSTQAVYRRGRALKNYILNLLDPPFIILLYHRVTELSADAEMLAVSPTNFRQHMQFLKQHFSLGRFDEDWAGLEKPAVLVTFDDGYADNVLEALPILEEVGVPATFFVSTGHIGTDKEFWWHQLEGILLRDGRFPSRFRLGDADYGRSWETSSMAARQELYTSLNALMQRVVPERREVWLDQLRAWAGPGDEKEKKHRSMSQEEIKRLANSPWATVGAHTVTHSVLSSLTDAQQREEIFSSKRELERIIGREITTFSYPFGRRIDYNRTSVCLCREAGFVKAASNFPGQVHRWTDPFQLPRHLVRNWNLPVFARELKHFWTS